jgi:iron-sulfur cluster insertion protein
MIELTDSAKDKITDILSKEENPNLYLRTFVEGGGCSGFNYGFSLDEEKTDGDWEFEAGSFKVLVDAVSMQYLEGATIDFKKDLMSESFVIRNPNAKSQCGCGSSFSI